LDFLDLRIGRKNFEKKKDKRGRREKGKKKRIKQLDELNHLSNQRKKKIVSSGERKQYTNIFYERLKRNKKENIKETNETPFGG